jgi:hypothetical protein
VIDLSDELQKALEDEGSSDLEAIDKTSRMLPRIKSLLSERIGYYVRRSVTPNFEFSRTSESRLIGVLMLEKEEQIQIKLRHKRQLHGYIDKLEWRKFENLCLITLKLSGFKRGETGKRTKDGGLDFFGLWPMEDKLRYKGFLTGQTLRVFGQAKHRNRLQLKDMKSVHSIRNSPTFCAKRGLHTNL